MKTSKILAKAYYSKTTKKITRLVIDSKYGKISVNAKSLNADIPIEIFSVLNNIYTQYIFDNIEFNYIKDNRSK